MEDDPSDSARLRRQTIDTYNQSAEELAAYFRGIGPRTEDIEYAFEAAGDPPEARVLEIGCGDGRDAQVIIPKASWYLGFDVSSEAIKLATEHASAAARFEVADAASFAYPENLDIVFAFASLLHLNKEEVAVVLKNVAQSLRSGGIFFISLKYMPSYSQDVKVDEYGTRLFYFYNAELIQMLAGPALKQVKTSRQTIGHTEWFETMLQKV